MPDLRFFEDLGPISLAELAATTGAVLARPEDGERQISQVAPLGRGDAASISFFADRRYLEDLKVTRSGACFVYPDFVQHAPPGCAVLITKEPHAAYAAAANRLHRARLSVAADAAVHPTAQLEDGVILGARRGHRRQRAGGAGDLDRRLYSGRTWGRDRPRRRDRPTCDPSASP